MDLDPAIEPLVGEASQMFDELCRDRHEMGEEEYGHLTFVGNDVMRMLMEELIDCANYSRYQFIKLYLLQKHLEGELAEGGGLAGAPQMGVGSFRGVSEMFKGKEQR